LIFLELWDHNTEFLEGRKEERKEGRKEGRREGRKEVM